MIRTECAARLAAFADGYGAERHLRKALPAAMVKRAQAMHDVLRRCHDIGREPWGTMYVEGHGDHWAGTAKFIEDHEGHWHAALRTAPPTT